jgi:hypothetical protein
MGRVKYNVNKKYTVKRGGGGPGKAPKRRFTTKYSKKRRALQNQMKANVAKVEPNLKETSRGYGVGSRISAHLTPAYLKKKIFKGPQNLKNQDYVEKARKSKSLMGKWGSRNGAAFGRKERNMARGLANTLKGVNTIKGINEAIKKKQDAYKQTMGYGAATNKQRQKINNFLRRELGVAQIIKQRALQKQTKQQTKKKIADLQESMLSKRRAGLSIVDNQKILNTLKKGLSSAKEVKKQQKEKNVQAKSARKESRIRIVAANGLVAREQKKINKLTTALERVATKYGTGSNTYKTLKIQRDKAEGRKKRYEIEAVKARTGETSKYSNMQRRYIEGKTQMTKTYNKAIENVGKQSEKLAEDIKTLKDTKTNLEKKLKQAGIEAQIKSKSNTIIVNEKEIKALNQSIKGKGEEIAGLKKKLEFESEDPIKTKLEEEKKVLEAEKKKLEAEKKVLEAEKTKLDKEKKQLEKEKLKELEREVEA